MRRLAISLIQAYKRFVSPYKGFGCAYRLHCGRASCSSLGIRAIRRYGVWKGLGVLSERTSRCGVAYQRYGSKVFRPHLSQRGDCDLGCDGIGDCDFPSGKSLLRGCDIASCCDCGNCDWRRDRKRKDREGAVYLPPKVGKGQR